MSIADQRNVSAIKVFSRKSMCCFFTLTTFLFITSCLFVLRSTGSDAAPVSIDHVSQLLPTLNKTQNAESSFGNRAILVDSVKKNAEPPTIEKNIQQSSGVPCNSDKTATTSDSVVLKSLKVFMYDLPSEFHFGLLDWKPEGNSVWLDMRIKIPGYPGGLNLQHSIEYWLTLDILASELPESSSSNARTVIRVRNSAEADIVFVPFFSSLCYNRHSKKNKGLQEKLVRYLMAQEEWKRTGGRDHLILAHHPNSMLDARMKLWNATYILSDFGRYPPNIANVEKDVIAPYKHVIPLYVDDHSTFESRQTLLYFQGAIHRKDGGHARQELFNLLKDEKDVHFSFGSVQKGGIKKSTDGMRSSKFCLNIAGDTPSSNRLFDAIASHCVPVIISDQIELPYEDVLDYSQFCIFIRTRDALKKKFLINFIRSIGKDEWTRMWNRLQEVQSFYEFQYPSKEGDAVQMIWQAVARKVPSMKLKINRSRRFFRSLHGK
ncbi:probable arabinosyltransferase ARAD1 [Lotus japonicus]|uniref:probable arabinosyltransferase ARAD1 n=1 Tax=Lotus japonicus TaxID=34305 RepID=UPI00258BA92B|nr:probable arabinosyltransferase ARAD1 [Lotus japonicus]